MLVMLAALYIAAAKAESFGCIKRCRQMRAYLFVVR